jgi:hypothetical protein
MNYKQILSDLPKYATTAGLSSGLIIALVVVFGFLNVIDAVPLLHQALSLTALYYMYKDRNNLTPKAKALFAQGTKVAQALLPPAEADS